MQGRSYFGRRAVDNQSSTIFRNSSTVIPLWVARTISWTAFSPPASSCSGYRIDNNSRTRPGDPGLNHQCSGRYRFYDHIGLDIVQILKGLGYL
jgi:hypothetical protein